MEKSELGALEDCDRLTLSRGEQVGSLARAACWEPCQSSRFGALPEQQVRILARTEGWEPCQSSRLGALLGQQVRSLAIAAGWEPCQSSGW